MWGLAVTLLCLAPAVMGCVQVQGCPGWAGYDTPDDAAESADAVVVGHVLQRVSTTDFNGTNANVWSVEVVEWIKSDGPDRIEVLSPPPACGPSADPYLGEDPLQSATRQEGSALFLVETESGWRTISPVQGLVELAPGEPIPTGWPAR